MNYKLFFTGDYLSAVEMREKMGDKPLIVTIANVRKVRLESMAPVDGEGGTKKEKDRGVVGFKEIDRGWVLNRTNAECLVAMWGAETDAWIGKRVALITTMVRLGGKQELGIRVGGSPDLAQPVTATIKLPRKKPFDMRLMPVGRGPAQGQQQQAEGGRDGNGE